MAEDSLLRELRQRETWLRASNELTGELLAEQPGAEALKLVARRAAEISGAPFVAVARPESDGERLVVEVVGNPATAHITVSNSVVGGVFSTAEPLIVPDIWEATSHPEIEWAGDTPVALKKFESTVLVPFTAGRRVLGVLMISRGRGQPPFGDSDLQMVLAFAAHAALAIEFARTQEDRERLAVLEERDRIARDLHDQVIQRMFSIGLGLQGLTRLVTKPEVGRRVAGFADELDETIREIRRTIFALQETPRHGSGDLGRRSPPR
jgi:signal transduction histidine kinase